MPHQDKNKAVNNKERKKERTKNKEWQMIQESNKPLHVVVLTLLFRCFFGPLPVG